MKEMMPLEKQSKKAQRAHYAKQRGSWNGVNPVTKTVPSGKAYSRTKTKQVARSLFPYCWRQGTGYRCGHRLLGCQRGECRNGRYGI